MVSVKVKCGVNLSTLTGGNNPTERTESLTTLPTLEDLTNQIRNEIPNLTEDGARKLAEAANEQLERIKDQQPTGPFAGCFPNVKPHIYIKSWEDPFTMLTRMVYPADYGGVLNIMPEICIDGIGFSLVGIPNTKEVAIHYVKNN